jgi:hypothetical protein
MAADEYVDVEDCTSDDSSFYGLLNAIGPSLRDLTHQTGDESLKAQLEDDCTKYRKRNYEPPVLLPAYKSIHLSSEAPVIVPANRAPANQLCTSDARQDRTREANGQNIVRTVKVDYFKDHAAAWQQDESVQDFLSRLPVNDPSSAQVGHWLWVGSPATPRIHAERRELEDTDAFIGRAQTLLDDFRLERGKVERDHPDKVAAVISRKMSSHRDRLESDLLSLAIETGTTCGKWMLFPKTAELSKVWAIVAAATADCKLGTMSKVGTRNTDDDSTLICVYTYDFSDFGDVQRVLKRLVELQLVFPDGKPIFYKCDA